MKTYTKNTFLLAALVFVFVVVSAGQVKAQTITNIYRFSGLPNSTTTNRDGSAPQCSLVLSGNTLYGTAMSGGSSGNGTVFRVNTDGSGFTNLHNFTATAGGGVDFVTLQDGGTVFKINTDGSGYTNIYAFSLSSG